MKKIMDDPLVRAARETLKAALEAAAGQKVKNLLIMGLIPDQPGSGTAQAAIAYQGCTCSDCAQAVLTAAARPFGGVEIEMVDAPPSGVTAAREVH